MAKKSDIIVKDITIRTMKVNGSDYICITDIARQKNAEEPKDVVKNWMRQKNTLEYLGLWEKLHNPQFKGVEFDPLLSQAGSNSFTNLENINAVLIRSALWDALLAKNDGVPQGERLVKLNQIAIQQMQILNGNEGRKLLK